MFASRSRCVRAAFALRLRPPLIDHNGMITAFTNQVSGQPGAAHEETAQSVEARPG